MGEFLLQKVEAITIRKNYRIENLKSIGLECGNLKTTVNQQSLQPFGCRDCFVNAVFEDCSSLVVQQSNLKLLVDYLAPIPVMNRSL